MSQVSISMCEVYYNIIVHTHWVQISFNWQQSLFSSYERPAEGMGTYWTRLATLVGFLQNLAKPSKPPSAIYILYMHLCHLRSSEIGRQMDDWVTLHVDVNLRQSRVLLSWCSSSVALIWKGKVVGVLFQVLKGFLEPDVVRVGDVDGQLLLEEESKKIGQLCTHLLCGGEEGREGSIPLLQALSLEDMAAIQIYLYSKTTTT